MSEATQETQKRYVRLQLENMWKRYNAQLRLEDHELVVLAVPTYPANIEAVSALDLSDINDLMAVFAKHREENSDELHPVQPDTIPPPRSPREIIAENVGVRQAGPAGPVEVGPRDDGGGAPQERAEPAPEPNEGDAAYVARQLEELTERPVFEVVYADDSAMHIYANGRVMMVRPQPLSDYPLRARIINRIPQLLLAATTKPPPIAPWIEPPYERIPIDKLAYHFGVTIEKSLAAQDHIGYMYRQRATVPLEDIKLVDDLMKQVRDVMGGAKPRCDCLVGTCTHRDDCRQKDGGS